jgi:hypothetical protein
MAALRTATPVGQFSEPPLRFEGDRHYLKFSKELSAPAYH